LLTVWGAVLGSRVIVKFPALVSTSAVYVLFWSMQVGGGFSKVETRDGAPSAGGQGVWPVTGVPGTVLGGTVVATELVLSVVSVVETESSRPMRRDRPNAATSATTTMIPIRR
jgi:hypothetical protein